MRNINGLPGKNLSQTNSSNYVLLYLFCFAFLHFWILSCGSRKQGRQTGQHGHNVTRTRSRENVLKHLGQCHSMVTEI